MTKKQDLIQEAVKAVRHAADCLAVLHAEAELVRATRDPDHVPQPSPMGLELQALDDLLRFSVLAAARLDLLWDAGERIAVLKAKVPRQDDGYGYGYATHPRLPAHMPELGGVKPEAENKESGSE